MACAVLYSEFGYGQTRIIRFSEAMEKWSRKTAESPEQWFYIDELLRDKLNLDFDEEDLEEREKHSGELYHAKGRKYREYS